MSYQSANKSGNPMWLPRGWSGNAFGLKFSAPGIILGWNWMAIADHPGPTVLGLVVINLPLIAIALFLLFVPVQLRASESTVAYRRWFHWKQFPLQELGSVGSCLLIIKITRIASTNERLLFFSEPQNEHLCNRSAMLNRYKAKSLTGKHQFAPIDWLFVLIGVASAFLMPSLVFPVNSHPNPHPFPRWLAFVFDFQNEHPISTYAAMIICISFGIVWRKYDGIERRVGLMFVGFAIGGIAIRVLAK